MTRYEYLVPCPEGHKKTITSEKRIYCLICEKGYERPNDPKYRRYYF